MAPLGNWPCGAPACAMFASNMCLSFHYVHFSLSGGNRTIDGVLKGRQKKNVKNFGFSSLTLDGCQQKSCSQRKWRISCQKALFSKLFTPLLLTFSGGGGWFEVEFSPERCRGQQQESRGSLVLVRDLTELQGHTARNFCAGRTTPGTDS